MRTDLSCRLTPVLRNLSKLVVLDIGIVTRFQNSREIGVPATLKILNLHENSDLHIARQARDKLQDLEILNICMPDRHDRNAARSISVAQVSSIRCVVDIL